MAKINIELSFGEIYATEIDDGSGDYVSNFDDEFGLWRLKGTEQFGPEELVEFVRENLKVVWDGVLDEPSVFQSYSVEKIEGPSFASYGGALGLVDVSVFLEVDILSSDVDNIDFDDLFHVITFELAYKGTNFIFTEFRNYYSNVL